MAFLRSFAKGETAGAGLVRKGKSAAEERDDTAGATTGVLTPADRPVCGILGLRECLQRGDNQAMGQGAWQQHNLGQAAELH